MAHLVTGVKRAAESLSAQLITHRHARVAGLAGQLKMATDTLLANQHGAGRAWAFVARVRTGVSARSLDAAGTGALGYRRSASDNTLRLRLAARARKPSSMDNCARGACTKVAEGVAAVAPTVQRPVTHSLADVLHCSWSLAWTAFAIATVPLAHELRAADRRAREGGVFGLLGVCHCFGFVVLLAGQAECVLSTAARHAHGLLARLAGGVVALVGALVHPAGQGLAALRAAGGEGVCALRALRPFTQSIEQRVLALLHLAARARRGGRWQAVAGGALARVAGLVAEVVSAGKRLFAYLRTGVGLGQLPSSHHSGAGAAGAGGLRLGAEARLLFCEGANIARTWVACFGAVVIAAQENGPAHVAAGPLLQVGLSTAVAIAQLPAVTGSLHPLAVAGRAEAGVTHHGTGVRAVGAPLFPAHGPAGVGSAVLRVLRLKNLSAEAVVGPRGLHVDVQTPRAAPGRHCFRLIGGGVLLFCSLGVVPLAHARLVQYDVAALARPRGLRTPHALRAYHTLVCAIEQLRDDLRCEAGVARLLQLDRIRIFRGQIRRPLS